MIRNQPRPWAILVALVMQGLLVFMSDLSVALTLGVLIVVIVVRRFSLYRAFRWFRGISVLLIAVLLARSLSSGFRSEFYPWVFYSIRLIASIAIAFILYEELGLVSILRTVSLAARILPGESLRRFVEDTLRSVLFLLPVVSPRLRTVREAYRIRRATFRHRGFFGFLGWTGRLLIVYVSAVASLPRGRAEALLLRDSRWT